MYTLGKLMNNNTLEKLVAIFDFDDEETPFGIPKVDRNARDLNKKKAYLFCSSESVWHSRKKAYFVCSSESVLLLNWFPYGKKRLLSPCCIFLYEK